MAKTKTKTTGKNQIAEAVQFADPQPTSKIDQVIALLRNDDGATIDKLREVTGWQAHSVRAALTGLKKKGHPIERLKHDKISHYRIGTEVQQ